MGLVKWQRLGCCGSLSGIAVQRRSEWRCILKDEKTFFKQFKKPLILFCNPQELMVYSDCNESAKDDTLLLK